MLVERMRGEPLEAFLRELELNQTLPRNHLLALQERKVAKLIAFVKERNPFYRTKYANHQAEAGLKGLPLLSKQELRDNYLEIRTPGSERSLRLCKTSGSTGQPLKFYRNSDVFGRTLASVYRAHRWHGIDVGAKEAMLWGIPSGAKDRAIMRLRDTVLNRFREEEFSLSPVVLQHFFERMLREAPEYVFGYTSMVYEFALFARERSLPVARLGLKGAICTAESISAPQREVIESVLNCRVIGEYGSAETGIISYECPKGKHHLSSDVLAVELLDDCGQPVPAGAIGRVVVSVLHSHAAPLIRYDLGDYAVASDEVCPCGVTLPLLERIVGRKSGILITPAGKHFHSIVLYYIMKDYAAKYGGVRQFQVRQVAVDKLEFHLATNTDFDDASKNYLSNLVRIRLGSELSVEYFTHDSLERTAAGKLRDFVPLPDSDRHLLESFRDGSPLIADTE